MLANENFICNRADNLWSGAHWFVYLNTASGEDLLVVGNGVHGMGEDGPYCSAGFSDGSVLDLGINVTELAVCENQIITKAAEHGTVCNDGNPW